MFALVSLAGASDVYVAQNAAGGNTGADCTNAHSAQWFNSNATGGNTYHLCGSFTGTAGSTMLTPPSGSAGNVVTVLFESGAVLSASYWGSSSAGAITLSGKSYVTIDGGSNGVIQNTANGTSLASHQSSQGIYIAESSHIEVRNLTIQNIYVNGGSSPTANDTAGATTADIYLVGNNNNILIHDNTLNNARSGIREDFDGSTIDTIQIYNNTLQDHCWQIAMAAGSGGENATNVVIHDNTLTGWLNWQCPSASSYCNNNSNDAYHTDGVIAYQPLGDTNIFSPQIYNNYIYGDLGGGSPTAYIYCTYGGGSGAASVSCTIFNNLLVNNGAHDTWLLATGTSTTGHKIYNNTLVGRSTNGGTAMVLSGSNLTVQNNIISTVRLAIGTYEASSSFLSLSNNNVFYNVNGGGGSQFSVNDGGTFYTWSQWRALGFDAASTESNPMLNASYQLSSSSSSAYQLAADLTSLKITALNSDKSGANRPATGPWDAGVYEYSSSASGPAPPTGLTALVQ